MSVTIESEFALLFYETNEEISDRITMFINENHDVILNLPEFEKAAHGIRKKFCEKCEAWQKLFTNPGSDDWETIRLLLEEINIVDENLDLVEHMALGFSIN
jgi:hypothetical protein